jgi:hypothetical protein
MNRHRTLAFLFRASCRDPTGHRWTLRGSSAFVSLKFACRVQAIRQSNDSIISATNHKLKVGFSARLYSNSNTLP